MEYLNRVANPRVMFTHLPWPLLPAAVREGRVKVSHIDDTDIISTDKALICSQRWKICDKVAMI